MPTHDTDKSSLNLVILIFVVVAILLALFIWKFGGQPIPGDMPFVFGIN